LPCFDRISSNFPIAKERKTRNGRGANQDQGQGQDLEAGREVAPDQDHQIDIEEGILTKRGKRRKGESPRVNPEVQSLIMVHQKIGGGAMLKMKEKSLLNNYMVCFVYKLFTYLPMI
jgi:hypothetical protein